LPAVWHFRKKFAASAVLRVHKTEATSRIVASLAKIEPASAQNSEEAFEKGKISATSPKSQLLACYAKELFSAVEQNGKACHETSRTAPIC
jgi:hypothetical protein